MSKSCIVHMNKIPKLFEHILPLQFLVFNPAPIVDLVSAKASLGLSSRNIRRASPQRIPVLVAVKASKLSRDIPPNRVRIGCIKMMYLEWFGKQKTGSSPKYSWYPLQSVAANNFLLNICCNMFRENQRTTWRRMITVFGLTSAHFKTKMRFAFWVFDLVFHNSHQ